MNRAVFAFAEDLTGAKELADALDLSCYPVLLHRFPDGESLVRVDHAVEQPILFRRLDRPNGKIFDLLLAAGSFAELGCRRPVLVAPYLPYMRQDASFHHGEAISQQVLGRTLDGIFSTLVTVDPHLHRISSLDRLFSSTKTVCLSASRLLAGMLSTAEAEALLVGPDIESEALVCAVASQVGADWLCLRKERRADRALTFDLAAIGLAKGRKIILVDDVCSSGATLAVAARLLEAGGAVSVEALVVHALHDEAAATAMERAGIRRLRSTDSILHPSNGASLAPLLAEAVREPPP